MITANAQLLLSVIERRGFIGWVKPLPCHLSQRNNLCDFGRAKSMQSGVPRPARKWRNLLLCTLSWYAKVDKIPYIWLFEPVKSRLFQGGDYFQEKSTFLSWFVSAYKGVGEWKYSRYRGELSRE